MFVVLLNFLILCLVGFCEVMILGDEGFVWVLFWDGKGEIVGFINLILLSSKSLLLLKFNEVFCLIFN